MGRMFVLMVILVTGISFLSPVTATDRSVDQAYASHDELASDEDVNCYFITAESGEPMDYSVVDIGSGRFKLFLFQGHHNESWDGDYYDYYSADDPVRDISRSFDVSSDTGNKFTIMIRTEDANGTSYVIDISFGSQPIDLSFSDAVICGGCGIIVICVAILMVQSVKGRRRGRRYLLVPRFPNQGPMYPQYPTMPPQPPTARMVDPPPPSDPPPRDPPPPPDEEPPTARMVDPPDDPFPPPPDEEPPSAIIIDSDKLEN